MGWLAWLLPKFASPWLLWGLGAAAAPVVIHLLNRRKYRETSWAAMRFLLEAVRKNTRRLQIEQLLLLAIRTLILILVALALARPHLEQLGTYFQANEPAHKVIVLDSTLSMAFQANDISSFDKAREAARKIAQSSTQGDAVNLVRISELPPLVIIENPAFQPADVVREIDQLGVVPTRGSVVAALTEAARLLEKSGTPRQKEVYFVSDFQRTTWSIPGAEGEQLRELLQKLDRAASLIAVDVGTTPAPNAAVVELTSSADFVAVRSGMQFKATVKNYGPETVEGLPLELLVDGKKVDQRVLSIPLGGEKTELFQQAFAAGGEHRVQARLAADGLALDNQRWMSVPARERIRILCVNGRSSSDPLGKATDFLTLALAPPGEETAVPSLFDPVVISDGELQGQDLSRFDCVVLCDVALVSPQEARLLESFLQGGGGVIWALGSRVQTDAWNLSLYRDGSGPLPARLEEVVGNAREKKETFTFQANDFTHPIVKVFDGNPDAGLETTLTYAYIRAKSTPNRPARVALSYDNGDPAILEVPFGAGRSVLITTALDDSWGNWALWPSFPPLIHETVMFAISGGNSRRQLTVGTPLTQVFPTSATSPPATIIRPDGETATVPLSDAGGYQQLQYDETTVPGVYEVQLPAPLQRTEWYAVNVDASESDLSRLETEELKTETFAGIEIDQHSDFRARSATQAGTPPTVVRGGLVRLLLYAALFLVFVELLMSWNFRAGAWLLLVGIVVALTGQALSAALQGQLIWLPLALSGPLLLLPAWYFQRRWTRNS